ncbi:MAG TPA: hypothetical protein HPP54_10000 [Nitrospinae bacterium]|nr:hypothetical protein [Nitrospinota bacterium]
MTSYPTEEEAMNVTGRSMDREMKRRLRVLTDENRSLREDLERRDAKIQDLCSKFGKANSRIAVLTATLMESLHYQWKSVVKEKVAAEARNMEEVQQLRVQIANIGQLAAADDNEYAAARINELDQMVGRGDDRK